MASSIAELRSLECQFFFIRNQPHLAPFKDAINKFNKNMCILSLELCMAGVIGIPHSSWHQYFKVNHYKPFNFKQVFSVLFFHNRQGTSEFPVYAFQEGQHGFNRANTDSGGPKRIQEGQYGFRRANTDPGGLIQIQ